MSLPRGTVSGAASGLLMAITEIGTGEIVKLRGDLDVTGTVSMDTHLKLDATKITAGELASIDGTSFGTATANKAMIVDSNIDIGNIQNISITNNVNTKNVNIQDGDQVFTANNDTGSGCVIKFQKSNNTTDGEFSLVTSNTILGSIEWYGSGSSSYYKGASIHAITANTPGDINDMPTSIVFSTTADAFGTPVERLRIDEKGDINIENGGEIRLWDENASGDYVGFKAHADTGNSYTLVMPPSLGSSNQYLMTDSSGNLNWNSIAGSTHAINSCRIATTTELTLSSGFVHNETIDGVQIKTGDRILIKDQDSNKEENGIYIVQASGSPVRADDYNSSSEIVQGTYTSIEEGNTYENKSFILTTSGTITPDTTELNFTQFSIGGVTNIVAGDGLSGGGNSGTVTVNIDLTEYSNTTPVDGDKILSMNSSQEEHTITTGSLATLFSGDGLTATNSIINIDANQTGITTILNAGFTKIGRGSGIDNEYISFDTTDEVNTYINNTKRLSVTDTGVSITGVTEFTGNTSFTGSIICSIDLDIEGDIDMATGKKVTWVDDNQSISGTASGITLLSGGTVDIQSSGNITIDSSGGSIGLGADADSQAINVGTGAAARTITVGNVTGATAVNLNAGTGGLTFASTGTGDIIINSDNTLLLDSDGVLELNSSGGAISIGNDDNAQAINVGTGAAARTITIGNVTGATEVNMNAGTGGLTFASTGEGDIIINSDDTLLLDSDGVLELNSSGGAISIGNDDNDQAINIGTQGERTISIGTGAFADTITIGNVTGATEVNLNAGTGGITLASTGTGDIVINSDDTLLLDADGVLELNSSGGAISIGNDDNDPMNRVTGGWVPAQMWKAFMKKALAGVPAQDFKYPRGMVKRRVNWDTRLLASADTPDEAKVTIEKYWVGSEPTEFDTLEMLQKVKVKEKQKEEEDGLVSDFFTM